MHRSWLDGFAGISGPTAWLPGPEVGRLCFVQVSCRGGEELEGLLARLPGLGLWCLLQTVSRLGSATVSGEIRASHGNFPSTALGGGLVLHALPTRSLQGRGANKPANGRGSGGRLWLTDGEHALQLPHYSPRSFPGSEENCPAPSSSPL
jgi:hypothetical protein